MKIVPIYTCPAGVHKVSGLFPMCMGCDHYDRNKKMEIECWVAYETLPKYFVTKNYYKVNCKVNEKQIYFTSDMEIKAEDSLNLHKKFKIKITKNRVILKGGF